MAKLPSILATVLLLSLTLSAEGDSFIRSVMTPAQFRAAGLHKLTDVELAALDSWLLATALSERRDANATASASASSGLQRLEGCEIVADDGTFLGVISKNSLGSESIANSLGRHGSSLSRTSIFNSLGPYGSSLSRQSPFNSLTSTPPSIRCADKFVAFLTSNSLKRPRVDPDELKKWVGREED